MKYLGTGLVTLLSAAVLNMPALAQQDETYDYWQHQREMVRRGQQAIFMCSGLFTSNRGLEQVFDKELAFLPEPIGTPERGDYTVLIGELKNDVDEVEFEAKVVGGGNVVSEDDHEWKFGDDCHDDGDFQIVEINWFWKSY